MVEDARVPEPAFARLTRFFALRAAPRRTGFAVRAALSMGAPVLAGVLAGHTADGLMATLGAFTALYGADRPYAYRAVMLALIAAGFALAVSIGLAASTSAASALATMTLVAMATTLLCRELNTGPPGAYLFAVACAVGTVLPAAHLTTLHVAVLVLAGGAFSWLAAMAGALFQPHEPERRAVLQATRATADFIRATGTSGQDQARHAAALALHDAWAALVSWQPRRRPAPRIVGQLRAINRDLHALFADAIRHADRRQAVSQALLERAKRIAERARDPGNEAPVRTDEIPLGRPGATEAMRVALWPGGPARLLVLRVGIAALVSGLLGAAMALHHVYWSIAASVLVLHAGFDWRRTVQRGIERLVGTWLGLLLAAAVLALHPQGLGLVAGVVVLQFAIQVLVLRNYAVAVIPITAVALLIAAGGAVVHGVGDLLLARGVDTTLGCIVGIAVHALVRPRRPAARLYHALVATLEAMPPVLAHLEASTAETRAARASRRALQQRLFALAEAFGGGMGGLARERREAERAWPDVAAVQRTAYEALSLCWRQERAATRDAAAAPVDEDAQRRALDGELRELEAEWQALQGRLAREAARSERRRLSRARR